MAAFLDGSSGLTSVVEHAAASAAESEDKSTGRRFGPYRIVRPPGAEEWERSIRGPDDDQFHKEVAIKTLKLELASGSAVSRFRYDARSWRTSSIRTSPASRWRRHEQELPTSCWRVGRPVTDWCEQQQLAIEDRLRLFRQVCDAVHAHQHLIVHRDIKPGNILVTAGGAPKLLDFGIAKLLDSGAAAAAEAPTATATGALLMTPDYASPEQVRGEAVSTATDVYSLGAVLYQLLTGQRPHLLQNYDAVEIARAVCETEIRPPSALGNRRLRGDLDNIVLRAMQKDPARRYSSAVELSEDIRRHLEGLPIVAREDAAIYRAIKFVRRHRLGVAASAAVVAALAIGVAVSLHEARVAQRRFAQVRELANTFLFQFYDQVTPLAGSTAVRASILETARKYLDGLSTEAGNDRDLVLELAQAYQRLAYVQSRTGTANLGQVEEARRNYQHALDLYARLQVNDTSPPDLRRRVADVLLALGRLEYNANREDAAEPVIRRMLNLIADRAPDAATRMLGAVGERSLGEIRLKQGHNAEALSLMESGKQALLALQSSGYNDPNLPTEIGAARERIARARVFVGDLDGALSGFQELLGNSAPCDERVPPGAACRTGASA